MNTIDHAGAHEGGSRRQFLKLGASFAGAIGLGASAAGCSSGSTSSAGSPSTSSSSGGKPVSGGNLNVGLTGGSSSDTLDPNNWITNLDSTRCTALYDSLVIANKESQPALGLAEEITPENPSSWVIRVRDGIEFHNGKTLGADDVLFTLQRILNPQKPLEGIASIKPVDVANIKKLDSRTLRVPMTRPYSSFFNQLWGTFASFIVPVDFDPAHPVGTGPFKYESFTPGVHSVFTKNPNYWRGPGPYLDSLTIIDFPDVTSQINALESGTIDAAGGIPPNAVPSVKSNSSLKVVVAPTGAMVMIIMRVDKPPWNDVRVRQAMRLIINRKQLIDTAYSGYATYGSDVFGWGFADFDSSLHRDQDIDQAKSLLKAAGQEGLSATLVTAPAIVGMVETAEVFQQNAKLAGVNISISQESVTTFFGPGIYQRPFSENYNAANPYIVNATFDTLPYSPFSDTHFDDPTYTALYDEVNATTDPVKQQQLQYEMQQIDFNQGGYIIPAFYDNIDAYSSNVHGYYPYRTGLPVSNGFFAPMWMSK